jgi:hypothetical protein
MYGHGPISGSPYSSLFRVAVPDPPYLWANERWSTRGVGAGETPAWELWDTAGISSDTGESTERWRTSGSTFATLDFLERWITIGISGELVFDEVWSTIVPEVQETPADTRFAVRGITIAELPAWDRWETEGAPGNITLFDELWVTAAPVLRTLDDWEQWVTRGIELAYLVADESWETHVPALYILTFEERWFFNYVVARGLSVRWSNQTRRGLAVRYQLGATPVRNGLRVRYAMTTRVAAQCAVRYAIETFDRLRAGLNARWSILDGSVIVDTGATTLEVRGRTIVINDFEINIDEGQFAWTCQVTLPNPDDLGLFGPDEPFTITIAGEEFDFIRQEPQLDRSGPAQIQAVVSGISPSAAYGDPRADKVTKTWSTAVLVSDLLEELFGGSVVDLRVLDWSIAGNRLAADGQTPIEIAADVARAPGCLLESEPDGALYIRHAWPVSVPDLEDAEPDHLFDDSRDAFRISEQTTPARLANRIRILDVIDTSSGMMSAEIDSREDGYNKGRTQFLPGDQPALLIFKSDDVEVQAVTPSAGNISQLAGGTMEVEETLQFAGSDEATLRYPTAALTSWKWLGRDLGTPELANEITVRVPAAGVAMLMVTYDTTFEARRLSGIPAQLAGEDTYDVLVVVDGTQT